MNKIYEGKAKVLYTTSNANEVLCVFKDSVTMFNGKRKEVFANKGRLNCLISTKIFQLLESKEIKTHFIKQIKDNEMVVKKVDIIPLEVIIRNVAAGSFSKRYGVKEGLKLENPTFEISLKNDELNDPLMAPDHAIALKIISKSQLSAIKAKALRINGILKKFFASKKLLLVDFKLEFGVDHKNQLLLADEFSPDNSRLWNLSDNKKMDKDNFRLKIGNIIDAYTEVWERIKND